MERDKILIEAGELMVKMGEPNLRIYDTTIQFYINMSGEEVEDMPTAHEMYLQGHIPGAAFFDHETFSDPDSKYEFMMMADERLGDQIGHIGISADSQVVVYANDLLPCATRAFWILRYAGHENVRILNGGLAAWKAAGGEVETQERYYQPAQFEADLHPEMFVGKDAVLAAQEDDSVRTVNTLTREWHANAHIPGSACLPCMDLMEGWDTFRSEDEIAAHLQEDTGHERIITYCGGGIAATVNAVAHLMLGNENVAVYDGSLYEWRGEGLPVESDKSASS
jgi:thiosulfate/3-mercaptopyruvate sulfurtransferase